MRVTAFSGGCVIVESDADLGICHESNDIDQSSCLQRRFEMRERERESKLMDLELGFVMLDWGFYAN